MMPIEKPVKDAKKVIVWTWRIWLMTLVLAVTAVIATYKLADSAERTKITNKHRQIIGDLYDPGHGQRIQIRDKHRRIIGYIRADGKITDTRRRIIKGIK